MDNENPNPEPESPQRNVRAREEEPRTPEDQIRQGDPVNPPPLAPRGADRRVNIQPDMAIPLPDFYDGVNRGAGQAGQDGDPVNPPPLAPRGADRRVNIQPDMAIPLPDFYDGVNRGAGQAGQDIDRDTGANIVTPDRSGSHAAREQQRRDNDREQGR